MRTEFSLDDLEMTVDFDAQESEPQTLHYPGCPAAVEPYDICILGVRVCDDVFHALMAKYEKEIYQACWDEIQEYAVAEAEHRRDCEEDR